MRVMCTLKKSYIKGRHEYLHNKYAYSLWPTLYVILSMDDNTMKANDTYYCRRQT